MKRTLDDVLKSKVNALHYGNRLLLPFVADVLKASVENDIITDFSSNKSGAEYTVHEDFTEIYFHDYKSLEEVVTKYEVIKLIVVEKGEDIFDTKTHRKISVDLLEDHLAEVKEVTDPQIFID